MYIVSQKLKNVKSELKHWNKFVFGDVNLKVHTAMAALDSVQQKISEEGFSDKLQVEEHMAQTDLQQSLNFQESFWKEKSRLNWHSYGDRNTSFFHRVTKFRQASKLMSVLKKSDTIIDDPDALAKHVVDYFYELYASSNDSVPNDLVQKVMPSLVSEEDNFSPTKTPAYDEIRQAVFDMNGSGAPGPDAFGGSFYQDFWDIIGEDVCKSVCNFLTKVGYYQI